MKIKQLDIKGFRSLYDVSWKPGDLNIVIGPNGSGKSNLLKVLDLLTLSARGRLGKQVQREGGMEPLVWDGRAPQISFRIVTSSLGSNQNKRERLVYRLNLVRLGMSSTYRIEHEQFRRYRKSSLDDDRISRSKLIERTPRQAVIFDEREKAQVAPKESVPEDETLLSLASEPFAVNPLIAAYHNTLSSWRIYQDFQTHREAPVRQPVITRSEFFVAPDGHNLISVLHTLYTGNRDFKRNLNDAMSAAFGDDFEELIFPPAADQRIQLRVRWKSLQREQTTADLSDGTLRFLLLITILANPDPPALIAIDEPATGLHPSMLPIIAEYAAGAALRSQVIMTTHSADFLDAFGSSPPTTTVMKWQDGKTCLQIVSDESLHYWLNEYTLGKMYRSGELEEME